MESVAYPTLVLAFVIHILIKAWAQERSDQTTLVFWEVSFLRREADSDWSFELDRLRDLSVLPNSSISNVTSSSASRQRRFKWCRPSTSICDSWWALKNHLTQQASHVFPNSMEIFHYSTQEKPPMLDIWGAQNLGVDVSPITHGSLNRYNFWRLWSDESFAKCCINSPSASIICLWHPWYSDTGLSSTLNFE